MKCCSWYVPRRTLLRGAGTAIGLPFLEAMLPRGMKKARGETLNPRRFFTVELLYAAIVSKPDAKQNCVVAPWTPAEEGPDFTLDPKFLAPFAKVKNKLSILTGISERPSGNHGTIALKLVPRAPVSTGYYDHNAGMPSIDHMIAAYQKQFTSIPIVSLDLWTRPTMGDTSQPRERFLSWQEATKPFPPVVGPENTFDHLFSSFDPAEDAAATARRKARRQTVLDAAKGDLASLLRKLGKSDTRKLDEFATGIRDFEDRLKRLGATDGAIGARPDPASYKGNEPAKLKAMLDLVVMAFKTDRTRVISMRGTHSGEPGWISYGGRPFTGVDQHEVSHYGHAASSAEDEQWKGWLNTYVAWGLAQYAYVMEQMDAVMDPDGSTVLDNSITHIVFDVCDSYKHTMASMPVLVGGRGGRDSAGNWNIKPAHRRFQRWPEEFQAQGDPPIDTARFIPRPGETTGHDLLWTFHNICGAQKMSGFGDATHLVDLTS